MQTQRQSGFTLLELMIVIAIIGILSSIAIPAYETYSDRSRFTEVVTAASAFKSAAEVAVQTGRANAIGQLNAGALGIPDTINAGNSVGQYVQSVDMAVGVITATATAELSSESYTLTATITNNGIRWSEGGSCAAAGLC